MRLPSNGIEFMAFVKECMRKKKNVLILCFFILLNTLPSCSTYEKKHSFSAGHQNSSFITPNNDPFEVQ
jgi:hypothetical protein